MTTEYISNEDISFQSFTLIAQDGENLGNKTKKEAIQIASELGLDVVVVSPNKENPICKIINLAKKMYHDRVKEKKNRVQHKKQKVKEIRFSVHTEDHDLKIKAKNINKFLNHGLKVKINIRFPKRQKDTIKPSIKKMEDLLFGYLNDDLEYEVSDGSYSNNNYFMEITPKHA